MENSHLQIQEKCVIHFFGKLMSEIINSVKLS